ncbi:MAG: nitrile hydratase accessory protein [Pseudomonadota bacterium]
MKNSDNPFLQEQPVFAEPWEAQAFALVVAMYERGLFSWQEWADQLSTVIHASPEDQPYYQCWLTALETLVIKKSLLSDREIIQRDIAWQAALHATPHGKPIALGKEPLD